MRALPLLAVLVIALAVGCGDGGKSAATTTTASASTESGRATTTTGGRAGCQAVDAPKPRDPGSHTAPKAPLPAGKTYTLTFATNCGSFTVTLDPKLAPHTTASLVALAKAGYFDDTIFHRVVRGFVIQGGDPTQTGGGGPGYSTVDPPPAHARYTKGVVAMAKTQTEAAGTAGSQFFVVTGADAGLPPDYAIVGRVTSGMTTVDRIDGLGGVDQQGQSVDGPPSQPVVIRRVTAAAG